MKLAYRFYMMENEGFLKSQRDQQIDLCIRDFRVLKENGYNPNDYIHQVLALHNLTLEKLTDAEARYIVAEVDK